jgi:hypothetical protein
VVGITLGESNVLAVTVSIAFKHNDTFQTWSAYRSAGLATGISRGSDFNGSVKTCSLVEPDTRTVKSIVHCVWTAWNFTTIPNRLAIT